jgi:hypothetical protein
LLRRLHPGWGAGRIRLELRKMHPDEPIAPLRTLQRWLRGDGLAPPPGVPVAPTEYRRATEPHEVWQMDAVEALRLKDGSGACWLRLTDECSGAILATELFPVYRWSEVPAGQTQAALRRAFDRWGRPGRLRVDNGIPWAITGNLPSALALWLAGLAVAIHYNAPHRPQHNGVVERSQGTSQRWAEPERCASIDELRERLLREDHVQREEYPAIDGKSRRAAWPALLHSGRGYSRGFEGLMWDLRQALGLLARHRVRRKVSLRGQVSLYHRLIEAGRACGGSWVWVQMDAETAQWVLSDAEGKELRRRPAPQFTREAIMALTAPRS